MMPLHLALASALMIGASFIVKKKGLRAAASTHANALRAASGGYSYLLQPLWWVGMATMIGTAPNAFAVGFIQTKYNIEIGFFDWMMFAVPLMFVMLPLVWLVLTRITNPVSFAITPDTQQEHLVRFETLAHRT